MLKGAVSSRNLCGEGGKSYFKTNEQNLTKTHDSRGGICGGQPGGGRPQSSEGKAREKERLLKGK